ncbi:MAG: DUF3426 domain-containing protein [Betaproteobacteria bacterium]|nr:MAG: DUF3426 domain-containing protein [Betaproteobacteria bacterium]TAG49057.1 MAG: DUF3426 domain-containing protein [Betaproteobacteria bacterium]
MRDEHVRTHAGLVRCGACRGIFDAREHLVEGTLSPSQPEEHDEFESPHTIVPGIPAVQHAPTVDADEKPRAAAYAQPNPAPNTQTRSTVAMAINASTVTPSNAASVRSDPFLGDIKADDARVEPPGIGHTPFEWKPGAKPLSPWQRVGYGAAALVFSMLLIAQSAYWFRDEIASYLPASAPALTALCRPIHCQVAPPQRPSDLGFVGADLAADPAHKGLLIFTATLRNTGSRAAALPSLVLTLDAVGGEPLARRVFSPAQYAPANANLVRGLDAAGELEIKLYIDASPMAPVGFKVDHAYL